ncbi:MAG: DDE-type integrase/transposase/recombinase [Gammaproteobacteria bacterium]|nr:MAG: DDE-type integrase/transposase/recombinase [Gammaproteobacteria bacterium]
MDAVAKELHKSARRHYNRRRVTLKGVNDLYQADLVEMIPYAKTNKGMKYIMTMINCFTKFAFAVPLKSKSGVDVARVLEPILKKVKFEHFQTDMGKEWFNVNVKKLMTKYSINHYATFSDMKASIVERLNRTLKEKMWREFTAKGSYEWLTLLPLIVKHYNNTVHRTTGMKPKDVRKKHEKAILARIGLSSSRFIRKPKFSVNDKVRISKNKRVFKKGYLPNWTNEIFEVYAVKPTRPPTYILKDTKGEVLKGGFYEQELLKSKTGNVYLVDKILKRRGDKVLVQWTGFDKTEASWVNKSDLLPRSKV